MRNNQNNRPIFHRRLRFACLLLFHVVRSLLMKVMMNEEKRGATLSTQRERKREREKGGGG